MNHPIEGSFNNPYRVTVLDGPPLAPIEENGLIGWKWVVGGTYTVTVDPQDRAPLRRGDRPGPPVIQQFLQIPLGLGLAFALRRRQGCSCADNASRQPDPLSHRGL
ncbi:hypothetical protein ACGF5O_22415 [Streptomyces sp. NPDC048291]|uniref:hypothetical protein n=1 Tax=Streptomyces sp. NPDC048291 TaxID=3365530 RepID=UPI00371BC85D